MRARRPTVSQRIGVNAGCRTSRGRVGGGIAEIFLDAQQLVVLGDAVGTDSEPVLIWPALRPTAMSAMVVLGSRRSGGDHRGCRRAWPFRWRRRFPTGCRSG